MKRCATIYLGRGPDAIPLATLHVGHDHPEKVAVLVESLDVAQDALGATDLAAYLTAVTALIDEWAERGYGDVHIPGDPLRPYDARSAYSLTYAAGRAWVRDSTNSIWVAATTARGGRPESREDLLRVLAFFEGIPGNACGVLLLEEAQR
ncbi:hypothetical protein [Amycolatopsis minnesotensis]|uniref:Uncharacterized protein n=1 Tax=Amycolatopsis minnesotensis TaxID=337894 RepID=A0ABP5BAL8_9PSEU